MRFFWISWYDNVIRFGRGQQHGSDQITEYDNSGTFPQFGAVCLYGYQSPVVYEVRNFEGDHLFAMCYISLNSLIKPNSEKEI